MLHPLSGRQTIAIVYHRNPFLTLISGAKAISRLLRTRRSASCGSVGGQFEILCAEHLAAGHKDPVRIAHPRGAPDPRPRRSAIEFNENFILTSSRAPGTVARPTPN